MELDPRALQGLTPEQMAALGNPADMPRVPGGMEGLVLPPGMAAPQAPPMGGPMPAPAMAPQMSGPPQGAPAMPQGGPPGMPPAGDQDQAKGLLGMIRQNWQKDPESSAFLMATGAALMLGRNMTPTEAIARSFMTGMAALGAVNVAHSQRTQQEAQMSVQQQRLGMEGERLGLEQQRVGNEDRRVGIDQQRADQESQRVDIAQQAETRQAAQGATDIGIRKQQLTLATTKANADIKLAEAQIANIKDDNARSIAIAKLNFVKDQVKSLAGFEGMSDKSPDEVQAMFDMVGQQANSILSGAGVQQTPAPIPGNDAALVAKARALNPGKSDEEILQAIKNMRSGAAPPSAADASGGGGKAPSARTPTPTTENIPAKGAENLLVIDQQIKAIEGKKLRGQKLPLTEQEQLTLSILRAKREELKNGSN